jgi:hypothetical protein
VKNEKEQSRGMEIEENQRVWRKSLHAFCSVPKFHEASVGRWVGIGAGGTDGVESVGTPCANHQYRDYSLSIHSTHFRPTGWTIISSGLKPPINTTFVESVSAAQETQIILWLVIIQTNQTLQIICGQESGQKMECS